MSRADKKALNDYSTAQEMARRARLTGEQRTQEDARRAGVAAEFQTKMRTRYPEWDTYNKATQDAIVLSPFFKDVGKRLGPFWGTVLQGMNDPILRDGLNAITTFILDGGIELAKGILSGDLKGAAMGILKKAAPAFAQVFTASRKDPTELDLKVRQIAAHIAGQGGKGILVDIFKFFTGKYPGEKKMEALVNAYGDKTIQSIVLYRQPIKSNLRKMIDLLTSGDLERNAKKYSLDDYFHQSMHVTFSDGASVSLEKNQAINWVKGKMPYGLLAESMPAFSGSGPTLREFIYKGIKRSGAEPFFVYKSLSYNCGAFLSNLLTANGMMTEPIKKFVNQNVYDVAAKHPKASTLFDTITDAAAVVGGALGDVRLVSVDKAGDTKHKWVATFSDGTKTPFGDRRYEDYTQHGDKKRRTAYRSRHKKDLETGDPRRAGYLSYYLLWGDSTDLSENVMAYDKLLKN